MQAEVRDTRADIGSLRCVKPGVPMSITFSNRTNPKMIMAQVTRENVFIVKDGRDELAYVCDHDGTGMCIETIICDLERKWDPDRERYMQAQQYHNVDPVTGQKYMVAPSYYRQRMLLTRPTYYAEDPSRPIRRTRMRTKRRAADNWFKNPIFRVANRLTHPAWNRLVHTRPSLSFVVPTNQDRVYNDPVVPQPHHVCPTLLQQLRHILAYKDKSFVRGYICAFFLHHPLLEASRTCGHFLEEDKEQENKIIDEFIFQLFGHSAFRLPSSAYA
jgi:hypothetical protein